MNNNDVYQMVTDRVIKGLEKGNIPWSKPWKAEATLPKSFSSKKPYRGVNVLLLWLDMLENEYSTPFYITFKQANKLGGKVKKGAKSQTVIFWNWIEKNTGHTDDEGNPVKESFPILRYYRVFNMEQVEGIEYDKPRSDNLTEFEKIEKCEDIINGYEDKPKIKHGGSRACYSPVQDNIRMPRKETFTAEDGYYATLFHELVHSTGHESRLNRAEVVESDGFGGKAYSREELTAEIGTAFLSEIAAISSERLQENQQAYINSWIKALQNDPKMITLASARAQKAVDYMQGIKPSKKQQEERETVKA